MEQARENANAILNKNSIDLNFQEFYDTLCMEPIKPPEQIEEEIKIVTDFSSFSNNKEKTESKESQQDDLKPDNQIDANSLAIADDKFHLGVKYLLGKLDYRQNSEKAFSLFKEAAKLNHVPSQYNLGYLYLTGEGCKQSNKKAGKWIALAAAGGDEKAKEVLKALTKLSPTMMQCLCYGWYPHKRECILQ